MVAPKISIIIPMYNVERYLRRCLDSVKNQTFTDWTAICIDDGSPDKSGEIAEEYAAHDKRFVVIHKKNGGVSAARNDGIKKANGEYIHFLDADDWIDSDYYEHMFVAAQNSCSDIVCSGFTSDTKYSGGIRYKKYRALGCLGAKLFWTRALTDSFIWRYLFRTEFIKSNNLFFDITLISQEDAVFVLNAIKYANWVTIVPYVLYHYMFNQDSALNNKNLSHREKLKKQYKIGKQYRKHYAQDNNVCFLWVFRKLLKLFI